MHQKPLVERAFELVRQGVPYVKLRRSLLQEGYTNLDIGMHLAGPRLKADLLRAARSGPSAPE